MTATVGVQGAIGNCVTDKLWLYSELRSQEERKKAGERERINAQSETYKMYTVAIITHVPSNAGVP
jgi:hypothetical protein